MLSGAGLGVPSSPASDGGYARVFFVRYRTFAMFAVHACCHARAARPPRHFFCRWTHREYRFIQPEKYSSSFHGDGRPRCACRLQLSSLHTDTALRRAHRDRTSDEHVETNTVHASRSREQVTDSKRLACAVCFAGVLLSFSPHRTAACPAQSERTPPQTRKANEHDAMNRETHAE